MLTTIIIWYLAGSIITYIHLYSDMTRHGYAIEERKFGLAILCLTLWTVILPYCIYLRLRQLFMILYVRFMLWWKTRNNYERRNQ